MDIRIDKFSRGASLVVLAGGRSSRMGRDKAFLKLSGRPIIEHIITKLKPLFENIIIVANDKRRYRGLGIAVYEDIIPKRGPLSGIHSGLLNTKTYYNFVVACDMPYMNIKLAKYLLSRLQDGCDVIACKIRGRYEPLFAIYGKGCLGAIEEQLSSADTKITRFFSKVKVNTITHKEAEKIDTELRSFRNINTIGEYKGTIREHKGTKGG